MKVPSLPSLFRLPLAASLLATLAISGCGESGDAAGPAAPPPAPVAVVTVEPETLPITNELPGRIAPTRIAEVRPRVSGILVARVFEQGSVVKEGDVLYRIDPAPFRVKVDSAKATLARAEATRTLAKQKADRQTQLKDRQITSDQSYDIAVAELGQADADVAAARAGLDAAELDLQYTEVRAPIGGRIGRALVTEGALVSATDAQSLATIQQLDPIYADFTQSANQLLALKRAAEAEARAAGSDAGRAHVVLNFDDGTRYAHMGRFLFSEAAVDASTGQIILRGEFPNPSGDLLPGMYVRVQIVQGQQADALAVPERAVQRDAGGAAHVFVVGPDNKAELRKVAAGRIVNNRWVIDRGLKPGDRVVVEGFQTLAPGAAVDPQPWQPGVSAAGTAAER
ncbi:efflux RND transporter periplasmic adaptor subunit [Xanthobacter sp. V0B-10]|uniref:efflux RND transporter periplasmic adaptor subunit n=1 Tax=Xanthobacter albus TaxID=3119929 RepID=UPI003728561A